MTAALNNRKISFELSLPEESDSPVASSASKREENVFPVSTFYDSLLHQWFEWGIIDRSALVVEEPQLPSFFAGQLQNFYCLPHQMKTKDQTHPFPLQLPPFIFSILKNTPFSAYLVGGGVYTFMTEEYLKNALGSLDSRLAGLPKECFAEVGKLPNDYDIRIYLHKPMTKENFEELKQNIIQCMAGWFYGQQPYDPNHWAQTCQFVKQNCFKKFKIEYTEKNQYLITTFTNGKVEIDLLWVGKLERTQLFFHNSLSLPLQGVTTTPFGNGVNGYQAIFAKLARIIQASDIGTIDFKGWFLLLCYLTSFYRCYVKDLEKILIGTALKHPINIDRLKWIELLLKQCLAEHLDKKEDPAARLCLTLSACRSLHSHGERVIAKQLYFQAKTQFPDEGLSALFQSDSPLEVHLALLQLFGVLAIDGKSISDTLNEFQPALQFALPGNHKSFTLLIPLQMEESLNALKNCEEEIDRYFDYFKESLISLNHLLVKIPIEQVLQNLDNKICYLLLIGYSLQKEDWSHLDPLLKAFFQLKPSDHLLKITERYFQAFLKNPGFTLEKEFAQTLFTTGHPQLMAKVFEFLRKEKPAEELISQIPDLKYKIKLLKDLPVHQIAKLLPAIRASSQKIALLNELVFYAKSAQLPLPAELAELYFEIFGYQPELLILLKMSDSGNAALKLARGLINGNPERAKLIWETKLGSYQKQEETEFLYDLFIRTEDPDLIYRLDRSLLGKEENSRIAQWIEKQGNGPLLLLEFDRSVKERQWKEAFIYLEKLLNLGNPDLKDRIKPLTGQLPEKLLLHPHIHRFLTTDEHLQAILSRNLIEKGLELFPAADPSINAAFIRLALKARKTNPKVTQYLLETEDPSLVEAGFECRGEEKPSYEQMRKYLLHLSPKFSKRINKLTTKDFLEALPSEYAKFISQVKEKKEWLSLIFELKAAPLFPVLSWMEEEDPTLSHITQCQTLFGLDERVCRLVQKLRIGRNHLPDHISLLIYYNLLNGDALHTCLNEALQIGDPKRKRQISELLQPHMGNAGLEAWLLLIKLLIQLKEEKLFDYLQAGALPLSHQNLFAAIDIGAAQLIKEPKKEVIRLIALLRFKNRHNLNVSAPFLSLLASTGRMPLLIEVIKRLIDGHYAAKEMMSVLESALKNVPQDHSKPVFDLLLKQLLPLIPVSEDSAEALSYIQLLCSYPKGPLLHTAIDLVQKLLLNKVVKGEQTIQKCLELCIKSSDKSLRPKVNVCLNRLRLATLIPPNQITKLRMDAIEQTLTDACSVTQYTEIQNSIKLYIKNLPLMADFPEKEKRCTLLALDCILEFYPRQDPKFDVVADLTYVISKISQSKQTLTKQSLAYFQFIHWMENQINPAMLPSDPNDQLFENALLLAEKILNHPSKLLELNHQLYKFLLFHMTALIKAYPDNGKRLSPLLHKVFLLQLPSGHDLTYKMCQTKMEIFLLAEQHKLFSRHVKEFHELKYFFTCEEELENCSLEQKQTALKNVIYRLAKHPVTAGAHLACQLIVRNRDVFYALDEMTLRFLMSALTQGILKNPFHLQETVKTTEIYTWIINDLGQTKSALAAELFRNFYNGLLDGAPSLLDDTFRYLEEGLKANLFRDNYYGFLMHITRFGQTALQNGNYRFPSEMVRLALQDKAAGYNPNAAASMIAGLWKALTKDGQGALSIERIILELQKKEAVYAEVIELMKVL